MGYYPVLLDVARRASLVVGGGRVAERKVAGLLAAGASVTVVSPSLTPRLAALAASGRIRHVGRRYRRGDLARARFAFVAVGDPAVSQAVAREAAARGVLLNVADDPCRCDFILPSILRRGQLVVAVSTGGASPALSRTIREELEAYFSEDWAALTAVVADVRRELRRRGRVPDADAWRRAVSGTIRRLVAEGRLEEARTRLIEEVGGGR